MEVELDSPTLERAWAVLLAPVTGDAPCGGNREYDAAFVEFIHLLLVKPETQLGALVTPAQEPDWQVVRDRALGLLQTTKDLRLVMGLVKALLKTEGLPGFCGGLALLHALLDTYWPQLYPPLDLEDHNDPTARLNVLAELCSPESVMLWLRQLPLMLSGPLCRVTVRDLVAARGDPGGGVTGSGGAVEPLSKSGIAAIVAEASPADVQRCQELLGAAGRHVAAIENIIATAVGHNGASLNLESLKILLHQAAATWREWSAVRMQQPLTPVSVVEKLPTDEASAVSQLGDSKVVPAGPVTTREDVIRLLDQICAYYEEREPSSPLPLLLQRCKKLVARDFAAIMRNLAPDAMGVIEMLRGPEE